MRDRRSTFTKEYISSIVNPLGTRPARPTEAATSIGSSGGGGGTHQHHQHQRPGVAEERSASAVANGTTVQVSPETGAGCCPADGEKHPAGTMLMPGAGGETADSLVAAGLGVLGATGALNGPTATIQTKDTTWTKLFVGGLPYHTTDKSLRDHFAVYGEIEEAVVITDRQTGKSRGYGFVIMGDRTSAERACKDPNPIIDGRKANVNLAILGAKPRGNVPAGFPFPGVRAGYPALLPSAQYGVPPTGYVYQNPYLTTAAPGSIMPLSTPVTHAAALAAATSQFYEYQNAVAAAAAAPYAAAAAATGQYTNGFDAYTPYAAAAAAGVAASAANYGPYTYAAIPQAPSLPTTAGAFQSLPAYQAAAQAQTLQEARLQ